MPRLYGLDALRGLAAIIVMIGHVGHHAGPGWYGGMYGLAVDFFLMLSGFVMARTYEIRMQSGLGAGRFLALRIRRLWPMAALGAVLAMGVALRWEQTGPGTWLAFLTALTFLPYPAPSLFPINGPRWSLFGELVANVVHALVLVRINLKALFGLSLVLLALLLALIVPLGDWPYPGRMISLVPGIVRILLAYVLGIVLWRAFGNRQVVRLRLPLLAVVMVGMIYLGGLIDPVLFGPFFVLVVCPLLVLGGASCTIQGRLAQWFGAAGTMSYPLYAIHTPLILAALYAGLTPVTVLVGALASVVLWVAGLVWWNTPRISSSRLPHRRPASTPDHAIAAPGHPPHGS